MASLVGEGGDVETTTETKRVFLRAERGDNIQVVDIKKQFDNESFPTELKIIQRQYTYYGPKFRVEGPDEQFLLTSPGPDVEGLLWRIDDMEWVRSAEVIVEFCDELPKHEICLHCGKPIKTIEHERESGLGICDR